MFVAVSGAAAQLGSLRLLRHVVYATGIMTLTATVPLAGLGTPISLLSDFERRMRALLPVMPTHGIELFRRLLLGPVETNRLQDLAPT